MRKDEILYGEKPVNVTKDFISRLKKAKNTANAENRGFIMLHLTVTEIAKITGAEAGAHPETAVRALCALEEAHEGGICYLTSLEKRIY